MSKALEIALAEYGVKEVSGNVDNERIMQYFKEIGHKWVKHDETAWCAAFVNWVLLQAGLKNTRKLNARSFLDIGEPCRKFNLEDGNTYIAVFWRGSPSDWRGHVAFPISELGNYIYCLGGNQSDRVQISAYPKARLINNEYRRLDDSFVGL